MTPSELEALLHKEIPITQALGITILELSEQKITVKAPFSENKNIHNTAFAGSIFTTATIAGWSLVSNYLDINELAGAVVLANAEIRYLKPINGDILASTELPEKDDVEKFHHQLLNKKRSKISLTILIEEDKKVKAKLIGDLVVIS